jgi:hypothetical protein
MVPGIGFPANLFSVTSRVISNIIANNDSNAMNVRTLVIEEISFSALALLIILDNILSNSKK